MTPATFAPWFAAFSLEVFGAFCSKSRLIKWTFGYLAASDLVAFVIMRFWHDIYPYAYWIQKAGKYALLCVLAAYLGGMLLNLPNRHTYALAATFALLTVGVITVFFNQSDTLAERLLNGGMAASTFLVGCLWLASADKERTLPQPWKGIALGLMVLLAGEIVTLGAVKFWYAARHIKWIAEYAQMGIWIYAPWKYAVSEREAEERLSQPVVRLEISPRIEVER